MSRRSIVAALAVLTVVAAGCDRAPAPPKRGKISGKITLDRKPVAKANVRFIALEASGFNARAAVKDGVYEVPEEQGLSKGKYRVEFSVPISGRRVPNPDIPGAWLDEPRETLPARYHRESQYILDYDPENPQPYDAALTSR